MSEPRVIATDPAARPDRAGVRSAIARAAATTGVDFSYLLAQARLESGLDPAAKAPRSSAAGLYQFTQGTWLATMERHAGENGMGWVEGALGRSGAASPAARAGVLALRYDADTSALMAAELAADNREALGTTLGREPDAAELYLGHFLGLAGARGFLGALAADPSQSAAALMPQAAAANRPIFYGENGAPRSVGDVMALIRGRMADAMAAEGVTGGGEPGWADQLAAMAAPPAGGPLAREFAATANGGQAIAGGGTRLPPPRATAATSMAATLAGAFAGEGGRLPQQVRSAYARLERFGL